MVSWVHTSPHESSWHTPTRLICSSSVFAELTVVIKTHTHTDHAIPSAAIGRICYACDVQKPEPVFIGVDFSQVCHRLETRKEVSALTGLCARYIGCNEAVAARGRTRSATNKTHRSTTILHGRRSLAHRLHSTLLLCCAGRRRRRLKPC